MTSEGLHRIERLFEQAARRFSGADLHPVELLRRVQSALDVSVHDGLLGNDITISFNPADFGRYESALRPLREEILALVAGIERRERVRRIGDVRTHFEQSQAVAPGEAAVAVRFADTSGAVPGLHGPTQRIMRHHGAVLAVGGERVPLTHTPFSIGRGVGNDLVIPDLSVSRRHSEIVWSARGFEMVDMGSRNGLRVANVLAERVLLSPGVVVRLGEVDVWLEEEAGPA